MLVKDDRDSPIVSSYDMPNESEKAEQKPETPPTFEWPWNRISVEDLDEFQSIDPANRVEQIKPHEVASIYRSAAQNAEQATGEASISFVKQTAIFRTLEAALSMHFRPSDGPAPYGPLFQMEGRRSAIPDDFSGHGVEILTAIVRKSENPVVQARLADVIWLLNRRNVEMAHTAIESFVKLSRCALSETICGSSMKRVNLESKYIEEWLRRALWIGKTIGRDKPPTLGAKATVSQIRSAAARKRKLYTTLSLSKLDLEYGCSDVNQVLSELVEVMSVMPPDTSIYLRMEFWHLAARIYRSIGKSEESDKCFVACSEAYAAEAEKILAGGGSSILAAAFLSDAVQQMSRVPKSKERRDQLKKRLIDVQSGVADEFGTFSHEQDLTDVADRVSVAIRDKSFAASLFLLIQLSNSQDVEKLERDAKRLISEHPLSSLFSHQVVDREGKVISNSASRKNGDQERDAIKRQIFQSEEIRRGLAVTGWILPAIQQIWVNGLVREESLEELISHSPFVPSELNLTFTRGFFRFLQGDYFSASYILIPLFEAGLRHVLKLAGHDVTKFNSNNGTQEDRTLGALFEDMRSEIEAIFRAPLTNELYMIFVAAEGPSIRNQLTHGRLMDGSVFSPDLVYACWLLLRVALLPLLKQQEKFIHLE